MFEYLHQSATEAFVSIWVYTQCMQWWTCRRYPVPMASHDLVGPKVPRKIVNVERNLKPNYWVSDWEFGLVMNILARCGKFFQCTFHFYTWSAFSCERHALSCIYFFFTCGTSFCDVFSKFLLCIVCIVVSGLSCAFLACSKNTWSILFALLEVLFKLSSWYY